MKITLILMIFYVAWANAQEYMPLTEDNLAYDVEIIVFARNLSQPISDATLNTGTVWEQTTQPLLINNNELPLIKPIEEPVGESISEQEITETVDETWQVPLADDEENMEALVWLYISKNMSHPIIERLNNNPIIRPLFHQKWRQPATEFLSPEFIAISSIKNEEELFQQQTDEKEIPFTTPSPIFNDDTNSYQDAADIKATESELIPDFSFDGIVSFSKQRFTHFQVLMNFYRSDIEGHQWVYSINQKNRIEIGQWQYFDHQQFGVLAKVVAVEFTPDEVSE